MKQKVKEWGNVIWRAAVILLILFLTCWPTRLEGSSMEPTYEAGDVVCFSRLAGWLGGYHTGDVVLFQYEDADGSRMVIKRVVAQENQRIQIDAGGVLVDGVLLDEPYAQGETIGVVDLRIPKECVFVLGDHREMSIDSRNMGPIPVKDIKGKVLFRLPFF